MECNRRHSYLRRIGRLSGVRYSGRHRERLSASGFRSPKLGGQVRRPNYCTSCKPTQTFPLRAPAETVDCASRTVENGGRERLWSGCEPKSVLADQIHSTHGAQSPRAHETEGSIACGSYVDMPLELAHETELRWNNRLFCCESLCGATVTLFERLDWKTPCLMHTLANQLRSSHKDT